MSRASAIRTARTAVTGAQNAGRMDSYKAAEGMGIKLKKEWLATLDGRTRHSHAMLDGEQVAQDAKFSNGCRFPGDPQGPPWEVYNCRCTLIAAVDGEDTSDAQRWARDPETGERKLVSDMSYREWAGWKEIEQKTVAKSVQSGTIKEERLPHIGLQFFANSGISKWKTSGIEKAISKWRDRILEHEDKIQNPEKYDTEWDNKLQIARDGEIYHWQK